MQLNSKISLCIVAAFMMVSSHLVAATFKVQPYLIYPNNNQQMMLLWKTEGKAKSTTVEWGTSESYGKKANKVTPFGKDQYKFTITGLKPATRYYYKVTVDGQDESGFFNSAPRTDASKVTFYGLGDTRFGLSKTKMREPLAKQMLKNIDRDIKNNNTFCIHSGDWGGFDNDFFARSQTAFQYITSRIPIMGVKGNHDGSSFGSFYPYVGTERDGVGIHSFEYGPAFIVCCRSAKAGTDHYNWIEKQLQSTTKKIKIIVIHHPGWCAYAPKNSGSTRGMQSLFAKNGVSLVITGHAHIYSRSMVNGIPHITIGSGSPIREVNPDMPNVTVSESVCNFLRVDINGETLTTTCYRLAGTVIETFRLKVPVVPTLNDGSTDDVGKKSKKSKKSKKKKK